jgi:hypothetical protein
MKKSYFLHKPKSTKNKKITKTMPKNIQIAIVSMYKILKQIWGQYNVLFLIPKSTFLTDGIVKILP